VEEEWKVGDRSGMRKTVVGAKNIRSFKDNITYSI
jgi:hypothetical protein